MTDDQPPQSNPGGSAGSGAGASGNRWEPAAHQPAADETAPLAGPPADGPAPAPYAAEPTRRSWRDRLRPDRLGPRARTGVAAGAAALVVGGVGGYAIGHATADGGDGHAFDGQGFGGQRVDGHDDHDGFPPQGQQGQLPGQSGGSTDELTDQQGTDS